MRYNVHLYTLVRVKVAGIEAQSIEQAKTLAEESIDLEELLENLHPRASNVERIEWAEEPVQLALVHPLDAAGNVLVQSSHWVNAKGALAIRTVFSDEVQSSAMHPDGAHAENTQAGCR